MAELAVEVAYAPCRTMQFCFNPHGEFMRNVFKSIADWLGTIGDCPFCGNFAWSTFHDCPAMRGKSANEIVNIVADKVDDILRDEPADRFTHDLYDSMGELKEKFNE
jgi:hypothetical protein